MSVENWGRRWREVGTADAPTASASPKSAGARPPDSPLRPPIETFYTCALVYYGDGPDVGPTTERALALIEQAVSFVAATRAWWDAVGGASH